MAELPTWRIAGRTPPGPPPDDWRERLIARLGQRPRRLGLHTELALFGALEVLAAAGEPTLPQQTLLRVCSLRGPVSAIGQVLEQAQSDLPLPFAFLQSQPSQMLAAIAAALQWQGDASFVLMRDPLALITLAARQAGRRGMLVGWVEESPSQSQWLRLVPCAAPEQAFMTATRAAQLDAPATRWLQLQPAGVALAGGRV
jgi:hypothetical protein